MFIGPEPESLAALSYDSFEFSTIILNDVASMMYYLLVVFV